MRKFVDFLERNGCTFSDPDGEVCWIFWKGMVAPFPTLMRKFVDFLERNSCTFADPDGEVCWIILKGMAAPDPSRMRAFVEKGKGRGVMGQVVWGPGLKICVCE
jgi:hypothetical protein